MNHTRHARWTRHAILSLKHLYRDRQGGPAMRRHTSATATAAALLLAMALTGCGGDNQPTTPSTSATPSTVEPSATPTESLSPAEQATQDATAALERFHALEARISQRRAPVRALRRVAIGSALIYETRIRQQARDRGWTTVGKTRYEILKVLNVNLDNSDPQNGRAPHVEFRVCVDVSNVDVVDEGGKSVVLPARMDRSIGTYTVTNYHYDRAPANGWKVSVRTIRGTDPC